MRRRGLRWACGLGLVLGTGASASCSTAEKLGREQECFVDDDCEPGELCLLDQGGVCLNLSVPARRPVLGLSVRENQSFRIEFQGCDSEIDPIDGVLRTDKRDQLSSKHLITAVSEAPALDCSACPDDCVDDSACRSPFSGNFRLLQASRLGQSSLTTLPTPYPLLDDEMLPIEGAVEFEWPRYVATNDAVDQPVILELAPEDATLARFRRELAAAPDNMDREFEVAMRLDCQRRVRANIRRVGSTAPVSDAQLSLFFNEPIATPATTLGASLEDLPACTASDECSTGHACNTDLGRCLLDLEGTLASRDATSVDGIVTVPVYNYCEDGLVSERDFRVELTPADGSGLPTMFYEVTQTFAVPSFGMIVNDPMENDLCLPDWSSPKELTVSYSGNPFSLLETESGQYVCCTSDCLPTATEPKEPTTATECSEIGFELSMETRLTGVDEEAWAMDGCQLPISGEAGRYTAPGVCEAGQCTVLASSGDSGPDSEGLVYTIDIESPPGSIFASERIEVLVDESVDELPAIELSPRVVVSGRVTCAADLDETCSVEEVQVLAERLRVGDGETPVGPFFYSTRTRSDGSYTLLADPGLYIMTAIPERGTGGGPSNYRVVDLRPGDSELVVTSQGAPRADLSNDPFELPEGVPVVLRLRDFETGGRVEPLDLGSWSSQAKPPTGADGELLDLNDPQTCYSSSADAGCQIRGLLGRSSTGILASISNSVDFTMRPAGPVSCPSP